MTTDRNAVIELPDEIRVPLHRIWADIGYLIGRAKNGETDLAVHTVKALCDEVERAVRATLNAQTDPTGIEDGPTDGYAVSVSSETPIPRTEAFVRSTADSFREWFDFAATLERELIAAQKELLRLHGEIKRMERE